MLRFDCITAILAAFVALHIPGLMAMSQPEVDNTAATAMADQASPTFDLVLLFKQDCAVGEFGVLNGVFGHQITTTSTSNVPEPTKPPTSQDPDYLNPRNDPGPPQEHHNPFNEQLGNGNPAMVEDMIEQYNRANPGNQIPPFVFCTSLHGPPRVYARREIWLAIQAGVHDVGFDVRADDRSLGAAWPRRLGFQRPINAGDAVGRIMEYPLGADEHELPLAQPIDEAAFMMDRVTFLHDGVYTGVVRYTNTTQWHTCYPHGWHTFQRGRNATRSLFQRGMGAVRGAWDRWLGYGHGGYERLDDEQNEQQQPQDGQNAQNT
ncbi:hypothetical protein F4814DRAFT_455547 [Daldinia grandis]|nr:hypothetical protein F4814DRAFT_455547 [Daldinia grandis]